MYKEIKSGLSSQDKWHRIMAEALSLLKRPSALCDSHRYYLHYTIQTSKVKDDQRDLQPAKYQQIKRSIKTEIDT